MVASGGVVLRVHYLAKDGEEETVKRNLSRMAHEVGKHEPDCYAFDVAQSPDNPRQFLIYEHYKDQAAFDLHCESAYFKQIILEETVPLAEERVRHFFTFVAGGREPGVPTVQ
jgi:quinol monooxygenase YgiN